MTANAGTDKPPSLLKVEPSKIVDLTLSKQNQYYALWAGYTAVQFAAASFGGTQGPSLGIAIAVLCGVWAFNLGHLGFVLQCSAELDKLAAALEAANSGEEKKYAAAVIAAFSDMNEGVLFWQQLRKPAKTRNYAMNTFVHLLIDTCASIILILRIDDEWVKGMLLRLGQLLRSALPG